MYIIFCFSFIFIQASNIYKAQYEMVITYSSQGSKLNVNTDIPQAIVDKVHVHCRKVEILYHTQLCILL